MVKWMYQALFFPLSSQRNKEAKKKRKKNAWSQLGYTPFEWENESMFMFTKISGIFLC